ncbi:MAG: sulfur globule protein CV3 [Sphingobacteriia bacterium]|nr:sulfur globule protein CV3 [Sphingobacteriia bacterium]NCC38879.1 sulfur globule protein CV3 [Gammaproteobacteria bacterium]
MNTLLKTAAGVALATTSMLMTLPANAFWGSWGDGPWYGGPWHRGPWWGGYPGYYGGHPGWGGWGGPWGGYGYPYHGRWGGYPYHGAWGGYPVAPGLIAPSVPASSSSAK